MSRTVWSVSMTVETCRTLPEAWWSADTATSRYGASWARTHCGSLQKCAAEEIVSGGCSIKYRDITLAELALEMLFPADEATVRIVAEMERERLCGVT